MRMLNENLLCKPKEEEGGGLITTLQKNYKVLEVIEGGNEENGITNGDTIYISSNSRASFDLELDNEKYIIVAIKNIILIL